MNTKTRIAGVAAAAVVLAGGGTAVALAAGTGTPATIAACANGGSLRQVTVSTASPAATPSCAASATPVQWGATAILPSPSPTTTSPSPSPTTTSPSPSPTPTGTQTGTPCVTSNTNGGCPAGGAYKDPADITNSNGYNTYVNANIFGTVTSQTLTSYSPGDWNVVTSSAAGDTSVEGYPDVQQLYTLATNSPDPLSGFATLTGTESETMPHNSGTIAEGAWDLWTNYTSDIMVWTDNNGRCNSGAQGTLLAASQTVAGVTYDVYQYGGAGQEIIFSEQGAGGTGTCAQQGSSSVDILAILSWVNAHQALVGAASPVTGLGQVQYGFEICSTGGTPETFTVSSLTIKDTCTGGGTGCQS